MTLRERWLTVSLILTGVLLVVLSFWQVVRYGDAQRTVQDWVQVEERSKDGTQGSPIAQARPEIRSMLAKGDFEGAARRMKALKEEAEGTEAGKKRGPGLALDKLWPPKSPERERARRALRALVTKQEQGYQMRPAQEALLRVADAARSGKRDVALATFNEAEGLIERAELRPGFRASKPPPSAPNVENRPKTSTPGGPSPEMLAAAIQRIEQFRAQLPQIAQFATEPRQKELLQRVDPLLGEALAAARARKDISSAMPPLMQSIQTILKDRDYEKGAQLLAQAETALRNAKPLPAGASPTPPTPPAGVPRPPAPAATHPMTARPLPPVGLPSRAPVAPGSQGDPGEQVLSALDAIRRMPEPVYRQSRGQILMMLGPALAGMRGAGGEARPAVSIGVSPLLAFGRLGEILAVRNGGQNLSEGLSPGGLVLAFPGAPPQPLFFPMKAVGSGLVGRPGLPGGEVTLAFRREGEAVIGTLKVVRKQAGPAVALALVLPVRAAGWRWQAGGAAEVIAVDGAYAARPGGDGKTPGVTLQGGSTALSVVAPTASEIAFDPQAGRLILRFPVGANVATTEYEVRIGSPSAPNPAASEPPK